MEAMLLLFVATGLLLVGVAIPALVGKVPRNPWYGVRVSSAMADERTWHQVNRYSARLLLLAGLVTVAAAIVLAGIPGLSVAAYAWLCLVIFVLAISCVLGLTWRHLRRVRQQGE